MLCSSCRDGEEDPDGLCPAVAVGEGRQKNPELDGVRGSHFRLDRLQKSVVSTVM